MDQEPDSPDLLPREPSKSVFENLPVQSYYGMKPDQRDEIIFSSERNGLIKDIELLYSTKSFKIISNVYMIALIGEYCLIFITLPFETVNGRPSSAIVPNKWSYLANIWSVIIQLIAMILTIITFVLLKASKDMFIISQSGDVISVIDMTDFLIWVSLACVIITCISLYVFDTKLSY
ncbi:putative membrane protein [Wickerhamomyces ciferrii]|uniref:Membrane protein n=1 Tax=Wickerhamomyces ciferrii (strain ATCC 14091 / BCRC 22168 / CBS 111 / JCM 3599 / NBRC 0793 / NRRL Y-1031 F-60-10) TaxID=1206466 RepID=K0KEE6_WICCF|nr:uncharacterized protein BN7_803 [Wickerhamomyces ciferrii]CCH41266.1 putative membrane protein [Wickerhamomyces ciferrii]